MTKQNGKEGNKSDKKRKNRIAHKNAPRIAKSKEKRRRGPLHIHMMQAETLKHKHFSTATQAQIEKYIPSEQDLMLQAKYAE